MTSITLTRSFQLDDEWAEVLAASKLLLKYKAIKGLRVDSIQDLSIDCQGTESYEKSDVLILSQYHSHAMNY